GARVGWSAARRRSASLARQSRSSPTSRARRRRSRRRSTRLRKLLAATRPPHAWCWSRSQSRSWRSSSPSGWRAEPACAFTESSVLNVDVEKRLSARSRSSSARDGQFTISVRFETAAGVTAVFWPSVAGKPTLVSVIAGLVTPDRGRIAIADTVLFDSKARINVPTHQRRIGYVFQEGRLFPHLSVASNLDYGRRMSGLPTDAAETKR